MAAAEKKQKVSRTCSIVDEKFGPVYAILFRGILDARNYRRNDFSVVNRFLLYLKLRNYFKLKRDKIKEGGGGGRF